VTVPFILCNGRIYTLYVLRQHTQQQHPFAASISTLLSLSPTGRTPPNTMSGYDEPSEIDLLNSEVYELKQILTGVETAKNTPDESRGKLATYCQLKGGQDQFLKADPGAERVNVFHSTKGVKASSSGGGGSGGGDCCVIS
jgi:hypothetical protein